MEEPPSNEKPPTFVSITDSFAVNHVTDRYSGVVSLIILGPYIILPTKYGVNPPLSVVGESTYGWSNNTGRQWSRDTEHGS